MNEHQRQTMTPGQRIIEHARAMQDKTLRSTPVKIRLSRQLWGAIRDCSSAIGWSATEWTYGAILQHALGVFESVSIVPEYESATREDSESFTIRIPNGYTGDARNALALAASYHKSFIDTKPKITLIEGVDYITERTPVSQIKINRKKRHGR